MTKRVAVSPHMPPAKEVRVKRVSFATDTREYLAVFDQDWTTAKSSYLKPALSLEELARRGSLPSKMTFHQRYGTAFVNRVCCWNRLDGHRMAMSGRWSGYLHSANFYSYNKNNNWAGDTYCDRPYTCQLAEEYETRLAQNNYTFADYCYLYRAGPSRTSPHLVNANYTQLSTVEKLDFIDHCRAMGELSARGELTESLLGDFLVRRNIVKGTRWYDSDYPDPQLVEDNNNNGKYLTVQLFNGAEIPDDFTVYDPKVHHRRWFSRFPFG